MTRKKLRPIVNRDIKKIILGAIAVAGLPQAYKTGLFFLKRDIVDYIIKNYEQR